MIFISCNLPFQPEEQFDFGNQEFDSMDPKDYGIEFDEDDIFYGIFAI